MGEQDFPDDLVCDGDAANGADLIVEASRTIASYWLPSRLVAFRRAYPQIEARLSS